MEERVVTMNQANNTAVLATKMNPSQSSPEKAFGDLSEYAIGVAPQNLAY